MPMHDAVPQQTKTPLTGEFVFAWVQGTSPLTGAVHLLDILFASSKICSKAFRVLDGKSPRLSLPQIYEKHSSYELCFSRAGVQGLEPRYSGPKPDVLPLDDTPIFSCLQLPYRLSVFYFLTS
jgi:hypothetical protein